MALYTQYVTKKKRKTHVKGYFFHNQVHHTSSSVPLLRYQNDIKPVLNLD